MSNLPTEYNIEIRLSKMYHVSASRLLKVLPFVLNLTPEGRPSPEHVPSLISMFVIVNSQYLSLLQGYEML